MVCEYLFVMHTYVYIKGVLVSHTHSKYYPKYYVVVLLLPARGHLRASSRALMWNLSIAYFIAVRAQ